MKLKFNEAVALGNAWKAVKNAFDLMEDIRPAGGFKEAVEGECKLCGSSTGGPDAMVEMDKAIRCLALELPASVYGDIKRRWDAVMKQTGRLTAQ